MDGSVERRNEVLSVLIVEGDDDAFASLDGLFSEIEGQQYAMERVSTCHAAIEAICRNAHDVCLVSHKMPDGDGIEVIREAISFGWKAPVIVFTDTESRTLDLEAMAAGAADYLVNSEMNPALLERAIRYAVERKQQEESLRESKESLIQNLLDLQDSKERVEQQTGEFVQMAEELALARDELQAALALADASERRYRTLVENSPVGIWHISKEGETIFLNPAMSALFDVDGVEGLCCKTYRSLVTPDTVKTLENAYASWKNGVGSDCEVEILRPRTGDHRHVVVSAAPMLSGDGQVESILTTIVDITDRKMAEELRATMERELQQTRKLESIGQLAGGIAHEINTPIQYIGDNLRFIEEAGGAIEKAVTAYKSLAQSAHEANVLDAEVKEAEAAAAEADVDFMVEELPQATRQSLVGVDQVSRIVLAMKEFSHPSTKTKQATDINGAIENTLTVCTNEWKHVADMKTDLDPSLPSVLCMTGEINQVFLNLFINAAHAIAAKNDDDKGRIIVSTRQDDGWVEVRITDTGVGIPEDAREKIFDPFFTTKDVGKGSGQGLAITRDIVVDKHGGTIHFETEKGKGTTFVVRLPIGG